MKNNKIGVLKGAGKILGAGKGLVSGAGKTETLRQKHVIATASEYRAV